MSLVDFWLILLAWQDMVTHDLIIHNISFFNQIYVNNRLYKEISVFSRDPCNSTSLQSCWENTNEIM